MVNSEKELKRKRLLEIAYLNISFGILHLIFKKCLSQSSEITLK